MKAQVAPQISKALEPAVRPDHDVGEVGRPTPVSLTGEHRCRDHLHLFDPRRQTGMGRCTRSARRRHPERIVRLVATVNRPVGEPLTKPVGQELVQRQDARGKVARNAERLSHVDPFSDTTEETGRGPGLTMTRRGPGPIRIAEPRTVICGDTTEPAKRGRRARRRIRGNLALAGSARGHPWEQWQRGRPSSSSAVPELIPAITSLTNSVSRGITTP